MTRTWCPTGFSGGRKQKGREGKWAMVPWDWTRPVWVKETEEGRVDGRNGVSTWLHPRGCGCGCGVFPLAWCVGVAQPVSGFCSEGVVLSVDLVCLGWYSRASYIATLNLKIPRTFLFLFSRLKVSEKMVIILNLDVHHSVSFVNNTKIWRNAHPVSKNDVLQQRSCSHLDKWAQLLCSCYCTCILLRDVRERIRSRSRRPPLLHQLQPQIELLIQEFSKHSTKTYDNQLVIKNLW